MLIDTVLFSHSKVMSKDRSCDELVSPVDGKSHIELLRGVEDLLLFGREGEGFLHDCPLVNGWTQEH